MWPQVNVSIWTLPTDAYLRRGQNEGSHAWLLWKTIHLSLIKSRVPPRSKSSSALSPLLKHNSRSRVLKSSARAAFKALFMPLEYTASSMVECGVLKSKWTRCSSGVRKRSCFLNGVQTGLLSRAGSFLRDFKMISTFYPSISFQRRIRFRGRSVTSSPSSWS
jgi:hypothetical protein